MVSHLVPKFSSADTSTEAIHTILDAPASKQPTKDDIESIINEVSEASHCSMVDTDSELQRASKKSSHKGA